MTKQHQPLYLHPDDAAVLVELAEAIDATNQRKQHSIGALCEELADIADDAWPELVASLKASRDAAAGGDFEEMLQVYLAEEYRKQNES